VNEASRPSRPVGFWQGVKAPWAGLYWICTNPDSWLYAAVPVGVALGLFGFLSFLAVEFLPPAVRGLFPESAAWYAQAGTTLLAVLATVAAIILSFLLGLLLAQPLSGPALERLVRLRERDLGAPPRPSTSFLTDAWRSLRSALLGTIALPLLLGLTLIEILVPGSSVVVLPLKLLVTAIFVAWDILDYPLSVRGFRLRDRLRFMGSHKACVFGFGLSLAVVLLLPCMQLLLLPAAVAGATAMLHEVERARDWGSSEKSQDT
jgi:CysZ protein